MLSDKVSNIICDYFKELLSYSTVYRREHPEFSIRVYIHTSYFKFFIFFFLFRGFFSSPCFSLLIFDISSHFSSITTHSNFSISSFS